MPEIAPEILQEGKTLLLAALALLLGGAVGWEREASGKWAGLRTHMLVCLASALFVRLGFTLVSEWNDAFGADLVRADPNRILEAVVTGIAFLGAGTIFRDRSGNKALGLTNAASLLTTGTVGVAVALESYVLAVGVTLLILIVLRIVAHIEERTLDQNGT